MSATQTYVHLLSPERSALIGFIERAESSFLELSMAPDVGRPTALELPEAREWTETRPAAASSGGWFPYLTTECVSEAADEDATELHYAGVSGMAVLDRVLRETTGAHPDVTLQSHTYVQTPREYTVYRYDTAAGAYTTIARGEYA